MLDGLELVIATGKANYAYENDRLAYIDNTKTGVKIFTSKERGITFISVKGSDTNNFMADWRINFSTEFGIMNHGGKTVVGHSGFLKAFDSVRDRVLTLVHQVMIEDSGMVVFCGHSAGGALAQILYTVYREMLEEAGLRVECVSFAAPRWVASDYKDGIYDDHILRVENKGDIVPGLPFAWCGYEHVGDQLFLGSNGKDYLNPTWRQRTFKSGLLPVSPGSHSMGEYSSRIIRSLK